MVSLQHQASSVESPKSLCLYPPQHNRADNITPPLLSFVYSVSLYTDCLMLSVCTSHSGAPTSAQAGMDCCNINAFLICAIWSKNVSPLWEGDINAKHKKDLTWVQNKRKDEDWTCRGWGMLPCRSVFQAKPFHRSDASLTKRSLLVRSYQSASWKQVFQEFRILRTSQLNKLKKPEICIDIEADTYKQVSYFSPLLSHMRLTLLTHSEGEIPIHQGDIKGQTLTFRVVPQVISTKDIWQLCL